MAARVEVVQGPDAGWRFTVWAGEVRIGRGAVVGARAVVSKSVPPGAIVVGNPARPVPKSRCEEFSYNPCEFLAANRAWLLG